LAGILAQTSGDAVVLGVGLNVSTTADELPVETATSLALCGGSGLERTHLLVSILSRLDGRLAQWSDVGGDAAACGLHVAYTAACATIGREVAVTTTTGDRLVGTAAGIDPDGRLRLDTGAVVGAGDVEHLRPAR
jgi:BirA family biotin operon repressor/biotin-[acetyl-CoA-carboxylase] ligase